MPVRFRLVFSLLTTALTAFALQSANSKEAAANKPATVSTAPAVEPGEFTNGIYRSTFFGFTCKVPFGWVDRTDDMRESASQATQSTEGTASHSQAQAKSIVLLAVFERPPEATGDTVNSAIVIAAEPASAYPGLRHAENYFGPLTELTKNKGFTVVNEPYEFDAGAKPLMRGDFSKELGKQNMDQSTLVMLEKGYVVSFTFIGGSEDEVDELAEGLSFLKAQKSVGHK